MKRNRVELTDLAIRAMAPGEVLGDGSNDAAGFEVRRLASGRWFFTFRGGKPRRRVALGEYPGTTLKDARRKARELRAKVEDGKDAAAERERLRAEAAAREQAERERAEREQAEREGRPDPDSFAALVEAYLALYARPRMRPRTLREEERKLRVEVLPALGDRSAVEIRRGELVELLETIREQRGGVCSNRTRSILSRVFAWAVERERVPFSPVPKRRLHKEAPRQRVLSPEEIRAVWSALDRFPPETAAAWRLILATGQRPGEVMGLRWEEIAGPWWTIPAERAKAGSPVRVYLNDLAREILAAVEPLSGGVGAVLPAGTLKRREAGESIAWLSHSTARLRRLVAEALGREVEPFTPHDCRRTAGSLLGRAGMRPDAIDRLLGHKLGRISATYIVGGYDRERRDASIALGQILAEILGRRAATVGLGLAVGGAQ